MSENILSKIPNRLDESIYSLYTDYESDHTKPYTTIIGCKVKNLDNIPNGLVGKSFNGGNYLKSTIKGDLMQGLVGNYWFDIFDMKLDRNYKVDFEIYKDTTQDPSNTEVDFYIGTK